MRKYLIHVFGILLFTLLLFISECSDPKHYATEFLWSLGISCLLWSGNSIIISILNKYIPWRTPAAPRIAIQIGISSLLTAWVTYFSVQFLYLEVYDAHFSNVTLRKPLFLFLILSWLYHAIYAGSHFFTQWRESIVTAEELKRQHLVSQYESLKNQVNPHFFFNSINTIVGLIEEDASMAKRYAMHFSKIYRYILEQENESLVPLKRELEIVHLHKQLLDLQFGEAIQIETIDSDRTEGIMIPPLSLQMLLENAIKHNAATEKSPLIIKMYLDDKFLVIKNNIRLKMVQNSTHIGLDNLRKRYSLISKGDMIIESNENFIVKLPIIKA